MHPFPSIAVRIPFLLAVLFCVAHGAAQGLPAADARPSCETVSFDVISIKPSAADVVSSLHEAAGFDEVHVSGVTVRELLEEAYGLRAFQLFGGPAWASSSRFDVQAKVLGAPPAMESAQGLSVRVQQKQTRLQCLLRERFHVVAHRETRPQAVYALRLASGRHAPAAAMERGPTTIRSGSVHSSGMTVATLLDQLSPELDHLIVDETGLQGYLHLALDWTPDATSDGAEAKFPSMRTALREQLGFVLASERRPVPVLVLDSVVKPAAD